MQIARDIFYVGVDDHDIDLFEGMYEVPNGMAYNSYLIVDEKVAVMDSVEKRFGDEWLGKIETQLGGRTPDYLVVQHMEPDHSANIARFMERYPSAQVVASAGAFRIMAAFFHTAFEDRRMVVGEGDTLSLALHRRPHGALARGHLHLLPAGEGPVHGRRLWQVWCA